MKGNSATLESHPVEPMKAIRVHTFGGLENLVCEAVPRPAPGRGQVLVQVKAAGVGPWDAVVRSGQSVLNQPLPLIPGSDIAGIVTQIGLDVTQFRPGDEIFGVTNSEFTGGYAEYAVAETSMITRKPSHLNFVESASVPVIAVTAWQMVFEYGQLDSTKRVLVHGAAGNVGSYAVQLAKRAGAEVIAAAYTRDMEYVRTLHPQQIVDVQAGRFEEQVQSVDVVLDTVGGETLERSFAVLKPGGILISIVERPNQERAAQQNIRGVFFIVAVNSERLQQIAALLDAGELTTHIGEVLPLSEAQLAHEMLAGKPHKSGKIILLPDSNGA